MKRCKKSPAKDKNLPLGPIVATRQISRTTGNARGHFRSAIFPSALSSGYRGQPLATPVDAAVASLVAGNIVVRSRGRPVDWFRRLQIT